MGSGLANALLHYWRVRHAAIDMVVEAEQGGHPSDSGKAPLIAGHSFFLPGLTQTLLRDIEPDIVAAREAARLAQQARKQAPQLPIGASEWAATEQLVELGGDVVEGLLIVQNYDHEDNSPRFREFSEAYCKRFQRSPGYSSVSAYDAATVVLDALRKRQGGETLKDALLKNSPYQGLQQEIAFDANGDTPRKVFFTEIRGGRYVKIP